MAALETYYFTGAGLAFQNQEYLKKFRSLHPLFSRSFPIFEIHPITIYAIQQYHNELEKIIHFGGSKKETAIRNSFYNLLNEYARSKDLMLIPEISTKNKAGKIITPDGTIKDSIRNDWGYWESKDEICSFDFKYLTIKRSKICNLN